MESRTRSSASISSHRSEGEGQRFCFCGLPSPRRTSWTQINPGRRFYGCARYKEASKCKYFKWIDEKFSDRATEVILDLLHKRQQSSSVFVDDLDDVDSMQAQVSSVKLSKNEVSMHAQASSTKPFKNEVPMMKIERKCYQACIMVLFCCLLYFMMKCKVLENEKKFLRLP